MKVKNNGTFPMLIMMFSFTACGCNALTNGLGLHFRGIRRNIL